MLAMLEEVEFEKRVVCLFVCLPWGRLGTCCVNADGWVIDEVFGDCKFVPDKVVTSDSQPPDVGRSKLINRPIVWSHLAPK